MSGVYIAEMNDAKGHSPEKSRTRFFVELLFSLNAGFAAISIIFCASSPASRPFVHLEVYLNELLGIPQTDYIRGYFTLWIPSLLFAASLLALLRFVIARHFTRSFFCTLVGMAILLCPAAIWTCVYERNGWSLQWPYKIIWGEAAFALVCVLIFLKGTWELSRKIGFSALIGHCVFWYWFMSDGFRLPTSLNWGIPGYDGPFGMLVNICALWVWFCYAYRAREHSLELS